MGFTTNTDTGRYFTEEEPGTNEEITKWYQDNY